MVSMLRPMLLVVHSFQILGRQPPRNFSEGGHFIRKRFTSTSKSVPFLMCHQSSESLSERLSGGACPSISSIPCRNSQWHCEGPNTRGQVTQWTTNPVARTPLEHMGNGGEGRGEVQFFFLSSTLLICHCCPPQKTPSPPHT